MTDWARYWAVDLHVHTPGSGDVKQEDFGTATDIVQAALDAGLDAIAITDHNTASWCDDITVAARDKALIILPGVEISTTEGHLLAIWEEETSSSIISELLICLGIGGIDQGKLDIAATVGFAEAAKKVSQSGGIAIAAHIDRPKGLLKLPVAAHVKRTLIEPCLAAVEITNLSTQREVEEKLKGSVQVACVRGSDVWDSRRNVHALSAIGTRRTWIKASRPDLVGIRHALEDPDLRLSFDPPSNNLPYAQIERVEITSGFLNGQIIEFCPDLNCLLGGTGTGKSLLLEAIRFALCQQVDEAAFPAIGREVQSRLECALGENGATCVYAIVDGHHYRIERVFSRYDSSAPCVYVYQETADDWIEVDEDPSSIIPIAAFSQGEILEYSRQPVGRMSLIDAGIDLTKIEDEILEINEKLHDNARDLISAKDRVANREADAAKEHDLAAQVRQISSLFKTEVARAQESWKKEDGKLRKLLEQVGDIRSPSIVLPDEIATHEVEANAILFAQVSDSLQKLKKQISAAEKEIRVAAEAARGSLQGLQQEWKVSFAAFKKELDEELEKVSPGSSLSSLRARLETLQTKVLEARSARDELDQHAKPDLERISRQREELLDQLHDKRKERRELRRRRVTELNAKAAGFVKLDIPDHGDHQAFKRGLNELKVGSRVREDVLESLALHTHPLRFARAMWSGDVNAVANSEKGIDLASVSRLLANIDDRNLWEVLLDLQLIDRPDVLTVKFRKPDDRTYAPIETLAHGQRCTAILVILLADGSTPVIVDQPEDALHAPWIEEYLVDRLRYLRGTRQYIFATRSPGIVVSGDAEQIITMKATAGRGEREASGSLERHDLNKLALHHLEGGPIAFRRRTKKLSVSVST